MFFTADVLGKSMCIQFQITKSVMLPREIRNSRVLATSSKASPTIWSCYANLNHCRAGFATVSYNQKYQSKCSFPITLRLQLLNFGQPKKSYIRNTHLNLSSHLIIEQ